MMREAVGAMPWLILAMSQLGECSFALQAAPNPNALFSKCRLRMWLLSKLVDQR
jgi:hypothetical protein